MHISKIIVTGFRAFDLERASLFLKNRLNVFIGLNSSGKRAALEAFTKILGATKIDRDIIRQDFNVAHE